MHGSGVITLMGFLHRVAASGTTRVTGLALCCCACMPKLRRRTGKRHLLGTDPVWFMLQQCASYVEQQWDVSACAADIIIYQQQV